jgi:hypothetical protein
MRNETLKWTEYSLPSVGKATQHMLSVMNNTWSTKWLTAQFMPYATANWTSVWHARNFLQNKTGHKNSQNTQSSEKHTWMVQ